MSTPGGPCDGVGPTAPAGTYGLVQFIVMMFVVVFILVTACWTMYMRKYRRRLRLRSPLTILYGSFFGSTFILIRIVYDLIGIEHFPCTLNVLIYYMVPVVCFGPDLVSIANFVAKQAKRQAINANVAHAIYHADRNGPVDVSNAHAVAVHQHQRATLGQYFSDLHSFLVSLGEAFGAIDVTSNPSKSYSAMTKVSLLRESSYEVIITLIGAIPLVTAVLVRILTEPRYHPSSQCTGCLLMWQDCVIINVLTALTCIPIISLIRRADAQNLPDPLFYLFDTKVSTVVLTPLGLACGVLYSVDPGGLMRSQQVDWMIFEMLSVLYIHCVRTVLQLYRTRRIHKQNEANARLIDILSEAKGAILFEKHLIAELANENLLFWREGIKYKLQFDKNRDFDMSQQVARVIYRTFISPSASLPINISGDLKRNIDSRFKGSVGRNVFDEALVEVYMMMQNGAFQRFVRSDAFRVYSQTRADFSLAGSFNPLAIVPSVSAAEDVEAAMNGREESSSGVDIKKFIQSL